MLPKKYTCKDYNGKELFFIMLSDNLDKITMTLEYSVPERLIMNSDVTRISNCIIERLVSDEMREDHFIPILFKFIQRIPGIEKYYLV